MTLGNLVALILVLVSGLVAFVGWLQYLEKRDAMRIDIEARKRDNAYFALESLMREIHRNAEEKGFWKTSDIGGDGVPRMLLLIHSEISEACEDFRDSKNLLDLRTVRCDSNGKPCGFPTEIADAVIRCMDLCAGLGIDLPGAILQKMEYNRTRPHMHGGKRI